MMKKILFVITQSEFGGAQRFLDTLVSHLPQDKYQVMIATGATGDGQLLSHLQKHNFSTKQLNYLVRPPHPYKDFKAIRELRELLKDFQPDTLFLCSSKAGVIGSLAANFSNGPRVIYRIGGWSFNDPWPKWKKKLWLLAEKYTAKYKDVIIVNNTHDFQQAKKLGITPRDSLELIYNGLDASELNFFASSEARLKLYEETHGLRQGQFPAQYLIGAISNFYPAKGLEYLIQATALLQRKPNLPSWQLVIIGDGQERAKLEALVEHYGLQKSVLLGGRINEARRYLKAFDVFVLPSVKEGFPWAILEAMGANLPVVATKVGAVPEVIEDRKNGLLVDPKKPQQLADSLTELLTNEYLRGKLGTEARLAVTDKFSLTKMIEQIERLL